MIPFSLPTNWFFARLIWKGVMEGDASITPNQALHKWKVIHSAGKSFSTSGRSFPQVEGQKRRVIHPTPFDFTPSTSHRQFIEIPSNRDGTSLLQGVLLAKDGLAWIQGSKTGAVTWFRDTQMKDSHRNTSRKKEILVPVFKI